MKYKDFYSYLLNENLQLAEKVYFNTGILNERYKKYILDITNGDITTKIISDVVAGKLKIGAEKVPSAKVLRELHAELKHYNKNVLPIEGFDYNNPSNEFNESVIDQRKKCIELIKQLPPMGIRNLKNDVRKPRTSMEFYSLWNTLDYIIQQLKALDNRSEAVKNKMLKKIFSSDNETFDEVHSFMDDKENLIGGSILSKSEVLTSAKNDGVDVVYDKNNVVILDIQDQSEMKKYGCNGLWCFTYGEGDKAEVTFDNYSTNGHVYLIIDFNEKNQDHPDFMHVLIKTISDQEYTELLDYINNQSSFKFNRTRSSIDSENGEYKLYDLTNSGLDFAAWTIYTITKQDLDVFSVFTFE